MKAPFSRRRFLSASTMLAAGGGPWLAMAAGGAVGVGETSPAAPLRFGLMTYSLGRDRELDPLIGNLHETKFEHAELRATRKHGVEVTLSPSQRREVRQRFEDAGIALSLASAFAYHWADPAELEQYLGGTQEDGLLAWDIGAIGIRGFPNAIEAPGVPAQETIEQIGRAVAEVATFGADHGVEIRLANHGRGTNRITVLRQILDHAGSPHVFVNWNCDPTVLKRPLMRLEVSDPNVLTPGKNEP